MVNKLSTPHNTYVIDIENATETARLIDQDGLFTDAMGGLLPEQEDMSGIESLLDIACGPGSWANEVAMTCPQIKVTGVDINQTMIDYARAIARVRQLKNAAFQVTDVCQPLPFADATFDFVNGRFLVGFLDKATWSVLLAECFRVLTPGGIARLTECEMGISSSPALQQLAQYLTRALQAQGRTFSADGNTIGIAHMLGRLLQQAGFQDIQRRSFLLDASSDSGLHQWAREENRITFAMLKPYLIQTGIVEKAVYDQRYQQMLYEVMSDDFTSISFGLTAWGVKPH